MKNIKASYLLVFTLAFVFCMPLAANAEALKVAMLIPGHIDDGGFMEAGYNGLRMIDEKLGAETSYIDKVKPKKELLAAAIRKLAADKPDLIIAHGGQNSKAMAMVATEFPGIKFVVVQGNVTGSNLSSYEILQEQSAWLAGAAAGLLTKTGVVGHISGIRVRPGLKGRGAFYNGLMHTNPKAKYLTTFAGDQDDNALSHKVAMAEIKAGADIIFTMLNAGRQGAIKAMRENSVYQIGNVRDWYPDYPDVFIASAVANVSMAGYLAAKDVAQGKWKAGTVTKIGLENPDAVSLPLAPHVNQDVRDKLDEYKKKLASGEIEVSVKYDGPEFKFE
jgi:basic membrane protein A